MIRIVSGVALAGALLLSLNVTSSRAQSVSPAETVKQRQEVMKGVWPNYYRDMSRVARGENPDIASMTAKAAQASETLKKVALLFAPGTGRDAVAETRAKPEVWTQKAEFDAALLALINETNALGETAKGGNLDAFKAQYAKVGEACGGCHGGPSKSGGKFRFEQP
jgi:cytochrome c556